MALTKGRNFNFSFPKLAQRAEDRRQRRAPANEEVAEIVSQRESHVPRLKSNPRLAATPDSRRVPNFTPSKSKPTYSTASLGDIVIFHFDDIGNVCVSRRPVTLLPELATKGASVCGDPLSIID